MPEANKNTTDYIFYDFYNKKFPKSLCFIHPNMITLFRGILLLPLGYNVLNNESILTSIILSFVIALLDIFDGAQARICNKSTKFGKYLDLFTDFTWFSIILICCIIKIFKITKYIY